jgi:hypothetical protein
MRRARVGPSVLRVSGDRAVSTISLQLSGVRPTRLFCAGRLVVMARHSARSDRTDTRLSNSHTVLSGRAWWAAPTCLAKCL